MNIRSLSNIVSPLSTEKVREVQNQVKSHDTADRDADGRQPGADKKRKVEKEELDKIIKSLREHPGVLANNLTIELALENSVQILFIKDKDGQIVRRIPEDQFYQLLESLDLPNGRILNTAA